MARELNLTNITFLPGQPKQRILRLYALADICLVPLRNVKLFETFIPSKMFEIMAMGRPIVASVQGEARDILQESGAALLCPPEDVESIADAVSTLAGNSELRLRLGNAGRDYVQRKYDRNRLAMLYRTILERIVNTK